MSKARKPKKNAKPRGEKPLKIITTVRVVDPSEPGGKALEERQIQAVGRLLQRATVRARERGELRPRNPSPKAMKLANRRSEFLATKGLGRPHLYL